MWKGEVKINSGEEKCWKKIRRKYYELIESYWMNSNRGNYFNVWYKIPFPSFEIKPALIYLMFSPYILFLSWSNSLLSLPSSKLLFLPALPSTNAPLAPITLTIAHKNTVLRVKLVILFIKIIAVTISTTNVSIIRQRCRDDPVIWDTFINIMVFVRPAIWLCR